MAILSLVSITHSLYIITLIYTLYICNYIHFLYSEPRYIIFCKLKHFFFLRWESHNIKSTISKCKIQWYLVHWQCEATITSMFVFLNLNNGHHTLGLMPPAFRRGAASEAHLC